MLSYKGVVENKRISSRRGKSHGNTVRGRGRDKNWSQEMIPRITDIKENISLIEIEKAGGMEGKDHG